MSLLRADFYCKVSHLPRERTQLTMHSFLLLLTGLTSRLFSIPLPGGALPFPYQHPAASSCAGSWWSASWWTPCPGARSPCAAGAAGEPAHRTLPTPCSSCTALHPSTSLSSAQSWSYRNKVSGWYRECSSLWCVFWNLPSSQVNHLWKLNNVKIRFKRASVILCIDFCPGGALPE